MLLIINILFSALLLTGCQDTADSAGAARHSSRPSRNTDDAYSAMQAARDRALVGLRRLESVGDPDHFLCGPAYCGADGARCELTRRALDNLDTVNSVREGFSEPIALRNLRRDVQRYTLQASDDAGVAVHVDGESLIYSRTQVRSLDSDALVARWLEAAVQKSAELAPALAPTYAACFVSYLRGAERRAPQANEAGVPFIAYHGFETLDPRLTFYQPFERQDGWFKGTLSTSTGFRDFRFRVQGDWTNTTAAAAQVSLWNWIGYSGYVATIIGDEPNARYNLKLTGPTPDVVLATAQVPFEAGDDRQGEMIFEIRQEVARVFFRGQKQIEITVPLRIGGFKLQAINARVRDLAVEGW